jgi:hypothetical protein
VGGGSGHEPEDVGQAPVAGAVFGREDVGAQTAGGGGAVAYRVVADHEGGAGVGAEVGTGFEEQLGIGLLAALLIGDDTAVDQVLQPGVGQADPQVPGEVADDADAQSAGAQRTECGPGVGVGQPGVGGGEFPVGRFLDAPQLSA